MQLALTEGADARVLQSNSTLSRGAGTGPAGPAVAGPII